MKPLIFTALFVLLLAGCAEQKYEAWGLLSQKSEMARLGAKLGDMASAGIEGAWQDDRTVMVGGYAVLDVGEPGQLNLPNPFDPDTPLQVSGQIYIGGQGGAACDLENDKQWGLFGGPIAGVRIAGTEQLDLAVEYQYRLAEGDPDPLSGWPMHSVVMLGAIVRF